MNSANADRALAWLAEQGWEALECVPLAGGDTSRVRRVRDRRGRTAVLKDDPLAVPGFFAAEAEGLALLATPGGPRVPSVLAFGEGTLLLEDLGQGTPGVFYWDEFAERLAALHAVRGPMHGALSDNWLGRSPQADGWLEDGWAFFAHRRILPRLERAVEEGRLEVSDLARGRRLCGRLRERIPEQPAVLLHGDLWSGNVVCDAGGEACLVDPAAHYGWAETDLAMLDLFGGVPARFFRRYAEIAGLDPGWRERFPLYQLPHLLNHLNLFGNTWAESCRGILARFGE